MEKDGEKEGGIEGGGRVEALMISPSAVEHSGMEGGTQRKGRE